MLDTAQSISLLTMMEIVGPILLAAVLAYGIYHSRRRRNQQPQSTKGTVYSQDRNS
jgi:FtsZ-interacting cell division protein ZipA